MIKTNSLSVFEIETIASNFRREYRIPEDEYFPILEILDDMFMNGLLSIQFLEDNDAFFEKDTPAKYCINDNFIYIKISVLEEYEMGNYRASFTLAHELFHYIQYRVLKFSFDEAINVKSYEDPEWQANEFAAQLLIPSKYVDLNEIELCERFHVSQQCVLVRKLYSQRRKSQKK
ncbi:MAG: ImmA/IrrE family metallo-endopeptidase [Anaeroplasma sp.]